MPGHLGKAEGRENLHHNKSTSCEGSRMICLKAEDRKEKRQLVHDLC